MRVRVFSRCQAMKACNNFKLNIVCVVQINMVPVGDQIVQEQHTATRDLAGHNVCIQVDTKLLDCSSFIHSDIPSATHTAGVPHCLGCQMSPSENLHASILDCGI